MNTNVSCECSTIGTISNLTRTELTELVACPQCPPVCLAQPQMQQKHSDKNVISMTRY